MRPQCGALRLLARKGKEFWAKHLPPPSAHLGFRVWASELPRVVSTLTSAPNSEIQDGTLNMPVEFNWKIPVISINTGKGSTFQGEEKQQLRSYVGFL